MKKFLTLLGILLFTIWSALFLTGLYFNRPAPALTAKPESGVIFVPVVGGRAEGVRLAQGGKVALVTYGHPHTGSRDAYMKGSAARRMLSPPKGQIDNLAIDLRAAQLIRSRLFFSILARLYAVEKRIRPGYYPFKSTDTTLTIVVRLTAPPLPARPF